MSNRELSVPSWLIDGIFGGEVSGTGNQRENEAAQKSTHGQLLFADVNIWTGFHNRKHSDDSSKTE